MDSWTGNSYDCSGNDHFDEEGIESRSDVEEFTVAIVLRQDTANGVNQLVEHCG
ncbi:hypothetical protein [Halapricum desulfuricans]|uniref:Uncharacterized protein n=1 Tax=Halapricum desulfuricans TaxID=2841257 RepID=A0A897P2B9_9EURY|nr:hypothetical protein [Halapricum desulfuricans]QSG16366.1 hypothetical protein HSEST_3102 [Halapricum desulfuricans]